MRSRPLFLIVGSLALGACGASSEQVSSVKPGATSSAAASVVPSATAVASAAPTASAAASESDAHKPKRQRPVLRFWAFDGPADGPAITGKRAWTAIAQGAASDRYRRVLVSVEDFARTDGKINTFSAPFGDVVSPVALAASLSAPASLKSGDVVFAENGNDSAFARVSKIEGDTVTMSYAFGDLEGELEAPRAEVVLVDGSLKLGAPAAFKLDGKWNAGRFLAKDATDAWLAPVWVDNAPVVKVKLADVRAIEAAKSLKAGDACLCVGPASNNEMVPGKVTKAAGTGVFYEVKLDGGATVKVSFDKITAPL